MTDWSRLLGRKPWRRCFDVIRQRDAAGPAESSEFWVLVPEAPSGGLGQVAEAPSLHPVEAEAPSEQAVSLARQRLDVGLERIRQIAAAADGDVRHADPKQAIQDALAHRRFDEVSTASVRAAVRHPSRLLGPGAGVRAS